MAEAYPPRGGAFQSRLQKETENLAYPPLPDFGCGRSPACSAAVIPGRRSTVTTEPNSYWRRVLKTDDEPGGVFWFLLPPLSTRIRAQGRNGWGSQNSAG